MKKVKRRNRSPQISIPTRETRSLVAQQIRQVMALDEGDDNKENEVPNEIETPTKPKRTRPTKEKHSETSSLDSSTQSEFGNDWYNRCYFQCKRCPKWYVKTSSLKTHLAKKHKEKTKKGRKTFNSIEYLSVRTDLECILCGEDILWEKESIETHAIQNHKMSLDEFKATPLGQSDNEETSVLDNKDVIQQNDTVGLSPQADLNPDEESERGNEQVDSHLEEKKDDFSWLNCCIFRCDHCNDSTFDQLASLRTHYADSHSRNLDPVVNAYLARESTFVCGLCSARTIGPGGASTNSSTEETGQSPMQVDAHRSSLGGHENCISLFCLYPSLKERRKFSVFLVEKCRFFSTALLECK